MWGTQRGNNRGRLRGNRQNERGGFNNRNRNRYNRNYHNNDRYQYQGAHSANSSQIHAPRFRRDNQYQRRGYHRSIQTNQETKQEANNLSAKYIESKTETINNKLKRDVDENNSWVLVFRQSYYGDHKVWPSNAIKLNENYPSSRNYSILHRLEEFRNEQDGKLEFKLIWPNNINLKCQHWKQTSNPTHKNSSGNVIGYESININYTENAWGGLEWTGNHSHHKGGDCLINGSTNSEYYWFYAIGTYRSYKRGIPGPWNMVNVTELWISDNVFDSKGEAFLKFFLENLSIPAIDAKGWLSNNMDEYLYHSIVYASQILDSCINISTKN